MRIAFLSALYPYRGGIAQFSGALFRALEAEHTVKAFNFSKQYPSFLFPGETQFVKPEDHADEIPSERTLNSVQPLSYYQTAKSIRAFQPDLYISNYWMTFFGPAMGTVAKKLDKGTKRIAVLHNLVPHEKRFFDAAANKFFLKHHDGFVVLSDAVERDLLQQKPDAKVLKVQHPVYSHFGNRIPREEAMQELGLDPGKKTILFFGIIRDYKGLDLLIEAFAALKGEYQLLVAGEIYGSFDKYARQIDSLGISQDVHLYNKYIADQEVHRFFSAADVCVLPYRSATQSGITAISQHFCVPLIVTDVGGLKETIRHNENGLVVSRPDAALISETLENYFTSGMGERFSRQLETENQENSWPSLAAKIVRFSNELN